MSNERLTDEQIKAMKAAAEQAEFQQLYSHEVRDSSGVVDWDLSTCESADPDADGDSIIRVYNRFNIAYFVEVTPERTLALLADNERLRARVAELEAMLNRMSVLEKRKRGIGLGIAPAINPAAGQDGDGYDGDVLDRGSDASRYILYRDEAYESGAFPMNFSQWLSKYGQDGD